MSRPLSRTVLDELVRWTPNCESEEARVLSRTRIRVEGIGDGRGRGETSSFDAAEGMTSLIRSSEASRRSLSLRCVPREEEEVSVDSAARTMTGVGAAVLAVLGLNRSWA